MIPEVMIRAGSADEAETYLALWKAAESEPGVTDDVESIHRLFRLAPESMLVAERDGSVVGTLIAAFDGWRGTFYRLAVHPDARRLGIAKQLVEEGERLLASAGCRKVEAIVVESRDPAPHFWQAIGFQRDNRVGRYVRELSC